MLSFLGVDDYWCERLESDLWYQLWQKAFLFSLWFGTSLLHFFR